MSYPRLLRSQEEAFNRALAAYLRGVESKINLPLLGGVLIPIKTTTTAQELRHGLGRVPAGAIAALRPLGVDVAPYNTSAWTAERLYVISDTADAAVTLYVW